MLSSSRELCGNGNKGKRKTALVHKYGKVFELGLMINLLLCNPCGSARLRLHSRSGPWHTMAIAMWITAVLAVDSSAQYTPRHFPHRAQMPPGVVGRELLTRGGGRLGYYQPVELKGPDGLQISLVVDGRFEALQPQPVLAGMLIGQVYRFKVTGIPQREGFEVFPTIEVIDRLMPPAGLAARFPIPVHLTREDLHLALDGLYVTRVIYVEDPQTALATQEDPQVQRYYEVRAEEDPLQVADRLGRPVAILRMGSRLPLAESAEPDFLYHSPPLIKLPPWKQPVVGELISVQPEGSTATGSSRQNQEP